MLEAIPLHCGIVNATEILKKNGADRLLLYCLVKQTFKSSMQIWIMNMDEETHLKRMLINENNRHDQWILTERFLDITDNIDVISSNKKFQAKATRDKKTKSPVFQLKQLEYVYLTKCTNSQMNFLVQLQLAGQTVYGLIHNMLGEKKAEGDSDGDLSDNSETDAQAESKTVTITSTCYLESSLIKLIATVPNNIIKQLNSTALTQTKKHKKRNSKKGKKKRVKSTSIVKQNTSKTTGGEEKLDVADFNHYNPIPTINDLTKQQEMWQKMIQHKIVDLTGFEHFQQVVFDSTPTTNMAEILVLPQTYHLTDFSWMSRLKSKHICLTNLSLTEKLFEQLINCLPSLEIVRVTRCRGVNCRILFHLLKLKKIKQIILDDPNMIVQEHLDYGVILNQEWRTINNHSLETLSITSNGLTLDMIDHILQAAPQLKHFVMNNTILDKLHECHKPGFYKEQQGDITFVSSLSDKRGFTVKKPVIVTNLLKDKYDPIPFSDSMVRIAQRRNPEWDLSDILHRS